MLSNFTHKLLSFFLITNSILAISSIVALGNYFGLNGRLLLPLVLFTVIVLVLVNTYVYVVLSTSLNLPYLFDKIKNKIASGQYKDIDMFQEDIANFLIANFNYPGADIKGGIFCLQGARLLKINTELTELPNHLIKENKPQTFKLSSNQTNLYIPISFEQNELGYIVLQFKGWFLPYTKRQLTDFVENYLDDQLVILLQILKL